MPFPHPYITLTPEEKKRLEKEIQRLALLRRWKRRKPLQALWLNNEKKPLKNIAEYLRVDYSIVRDWVYRYRKCGLEGFIAWVNRPGPRLPYGGQAKPPRKKSR